MIAYGHCHCRPGCLSPVRASDATVQTPAGVALSVHLTVPAVPVDGLTSLTSPLSKVSAR